MSFKERVLSLPGPAHPIFQRMFKQTDLQVQVIFYFVCFLHLISFAFFHSQVRFDQLCKTQFESAAKDLRNFSLLMIAS